MSRNEIKETESHHHSTPLSSADQGSAGLSKPPPHPIFGTLYPGIRVGVFSVLPGQNRLVSACLESRGLFGWRLIRLLSRFSTAGSRLRKHFASS